MQHRIFNRVVDIPVAARLRHLGVGGDLETCVLFNRQLARRLSVLIEFVHVPALAFERGAAVHQPCTWREFDGRVVEHRGLLEGALDFQGNQQRVVGIAQFVEHHAHPVWREHQFAVRIAHHAADSIVEFLGRKFGCANAELAGDAAEVVQR